MDDQVVDIVRGGVGALEHIVEAAGAQRIKMEQR